MNKGDEASGVGPEERLSPEARRAIDAHLRKKVLAPVLGILGLLGIGGWLTISARVANAADDLIEGKSFERLAAEAQSRLSKDAAFIGGVSAEIGRITLPVGSVLPLFVSFTDEELYKLLPRNWVLCNGDLVDGSHPRKFLPDEVEPRLWGRQSPNLNGRFLIGTSNLAEVGVPAGNPQFPSIQVRESGMHTHAIIAAGEHSHTIAPSGDHSHSVPAHRHGLPATTGPVTGEGGDPGAQAYTVRDDNAGWTNGHHLVVSGGASTQEGQHRHRLGGQTEATGAVEVRGGQHTHQSDASGSHTHQSSEAGGHTHDVAPVNYSPPSVACRFIMRIK